MGWKVYEAENGEKTVALLQLSVTRENAGVSTLVLYSDNGTPKKSGALLTKMYDLGITSPIGIPRVRNANPYRCAV